MKNNTSVTSIYENTEKMKQLTESIKDAFVSYLNCDPELKNNMICDDEAAALIVKVKALTDDCYKTLVIIYSVMKKILVYSFFMRESLKFGHRKNQKENLKLESSYSGMQTTCKYYIM